MPDTHGAKGAWNRQWETWVGWAMRDPNPNEEGGWVTA